MKDEIYEVGDDVVRLTRVEIHRYDWGFDSKGNPGHPMEKSRYEVRVNGVLRGHIVYPHGFGKGWQAFSLNRPYDVEDVRLDLHLDRRRHGLKQEGLAKLFPGWIAEGHAPTREEVAAEKVRRAEERARDKIESAQRQAQWKAEREKQAREVEAHRKETLEGLESIRDRLGGQLSNYEAEMLHRAIQKWQPKE